MQYQYEAKRRIRLGVVGVGSHSYRNILPSLTFLPVELVAVADVDLTKASAVARQYGCAAFPSAAAMFASEQLDAVLLCVSPQLHPQLAIEAFQVGLHVWMEKPAANRAGPVQAMIAARGDRVCVVGYKKAFMPATQKAIELLGLEENRPLRTLLGVYPCVLPQDGPAALESGANTEWLANGCHPLSALLAIGGPAASVAVHRAKRGGTVCILTHRDGALSNLHLPQGAPMSQPFERYLVVGGDHAIEIENARRLIYQRGIPFPYTTVTSFAGPGVDTGAVVWEAQDGLNTLENKGVFTQGLFGGLDHFVSAVLDGSKPTIGTLEFALNLTRVWEAVHLSDGGGIAIEA